MSRELPVILNTEMVKAVLSGNKVCTRRPVKCKSRKAEGFEIYTLDDGTFCGFFDVDGDGFALNEDGVMNKPPCQKDDTLYVRETWGTFEDCHIDTESQRYFYRADMDGDSEEIRQDYIRIGYSYQFKPSIHMPKKAARLFLKVTNVRAERLNDISDDDCLREGIEIISNDPDEYFCRDYSKKRSIENWTFFNENERDSFKTLWNSIYKNWDLNPWVWVIDFEVVKL